jgi:hypothetical protein
VFGWGLAVPVAAPDAGEALVVTHDDRTGRLQIATRSRGRSVQLIITSEPLSARKPGLKPPGCCPIGGDYEWAQVPSDLRVFREFRLSVDGRTRTISRRLTERFVHPHTDEALAAVSTDGRNLFVCMYLGDGAGAAMAVWSLSLGTGADWARAGELISDWDYPEAPGSSEACRATGEAAPRIRGANRRWPIVMR